MQGDLFLRRQCIGWRAHQQRIGLDGLRRFGVGDRVFSADGAGTHDQRQTAAQHVLGLGGQVETLLSGVGIIFAG
ncbi:hypothetical protein D3C71_2054810 [compost metagenome]